MIRRPWAGDGIDNPNPDLNPNLNPNDFFNHETPED
jgi:hypothetical protein